MKSKVRNVKIAEYDFASQSEMQKARFILAFQLLKSNMQKTRCILAIHLFKTPSGNFIQAYFASRKHEARGTKQDASQLFSKVHPTLGGNISPGPSEYHKARCTLPYFIQAYFLHKARCISVLSKVHL